MSYPYLFNTLNIGADLPFSAVATELAEAVVAGDVVVQAPPGTGKTTLVPPIVANAYPGRVIVTAPRRVAVRAAARRLAALSGTTLGQEVGFSIRGQSRRSAATRIEFVTPGVLLRRLLREGDIDASAVVFDEVHERGLDTDLALGMVRELREIRDDLRIVAMSATVDAERFATLLGHGRPTPIVSASAQTHPLEVRYAPFSPRLDARGVSEDFLRHVAEQAAHLLQDHSRDGDVLVFVPGIGEIERCSAHLCALLGADSEVEILHLHGGQSPQDQDRIFSPGTARRAIIATAVAESSVTVPRVRAVVDAGLARSPRLDVARGISGLVTTSAPQSSAQQRAGRAARLGPGVVVRCYSATEFAAFPAWPMPEIAVADLTQAMLDAAVWGTPEMAGLRLLDPPPPSHTRAAVATLTDLGALDDSGAVTELGRQLATLPLHPRWGRALLTGAAMAPQRAAEIAGYVEKLSETRSLAATVRTLAPAKSPEPVSLSRDEVPAFVTALAWPDFVGRRRTSSSREYLLASGSAATAPAHLSEHEWLAIAEVSRDRDGRGRIRAAEPISQELALACLRPTWHRSRHTWVEGARVRAREVEAVGAIELSSRQVAPTPADCAAALSHWLRDGNLTATADAQQLRRRLALLHHRRGAPWPEVSDAALAEAVEILFAGELTQPIVPTLDEQRLRRLLPWPQASELEDLVPQRIQVPSGSRITLSYPEDPAAEDAQIVAAVKLQECFGMAETPQVLGCAVTMHLLSPAGRPVALTQDLESFWNGPYQQVRSELRGRYPKHPWPENPWEEPATRGTKRR